MKLPGYAILKEVTKWREMTLGEVCEMLPNKYGDHRDFYDLATLYTGRLVETSIQREGCNWDTEKTSWVAEEIFTMSKGKGTFNVPGMPQFTNEVDYREVCKVFCTGNADLLFEQYRQKRIERLWALGVVSGYCSSMNVGCWCSILSVTPKTPPLMSTVPTSPPRAEHIGGR